MEPVTAIVTALSAGATVLASGALNEAGKDAYISLKKAVMQFVSPDDVAKLEAAPDSAARRGVVAEEIQRAGKDEDSDLAGLAQALVATLKAEAPETGNISFEDIEAANITLEQMTARGDFSSKGMKAEKDFRASDIHAGKTSR